MHQKMKETGICVEIDHIVEDNNLKHVCSHSWGAADRATKADAGATRVHRMASFILVLKEK